MARLTNAKQKSESSVQSEEGKSTLRDNFDYLSPLDTRYYGQDARVYDALHPYLSEAATIQYQIKVEQAIIASLEQAGVAPFGISKRVARAVSQVTPAVVYEEEHRTHHNIRALVNSLGRYLEERDRPYIHLFATSADVQDTARSLALRDFTRDVLLPELSKLILRLATLAREHADFPQIGRTHGRFAEPITVGYWLANFVVRLTGRAEKIALAAKDLRGMYSGAVGAHSALALKWPNDPAAIEIDVLARLGLEPAEGSISTQVIQPEYLTDYAHALVSMFGVLANVADDYRHLMRSEIGEVEEDLDIEVEARKYQIGSSTMPHKINPKNFENVKSLWKAFVPRMMTVYMDQISEHQRDLTNSASSRFFNELAGGAYYAVLRLEDAISKTKISVDTIKENLSSSRAQLIDAEPLYIAFALTGHPNGYYMARSLVLKARESGSDLLSLVEADPEARTLWDRVPEETKEIIRDPTKYIGDSIQRTHLVCDQAEIRLKNPWFLRRLERPSESKAFLLE
ncbi:MAG: lyase family protein [Methylocella sp.]